MDFRRSDDPAQKRDPRWEGIKGLSKEMKLGLTTELKLAFLNQLDDVAFTTTHSQSYGILPEMAGINMYKPSNKPSKIVQYSVFLFMIGNYWVYMQTWIFFPI